MIVCEVVALDRRRCKVLTDQDFAFVLYKGEIGRYEITEGKELSEQVYQDILQNILIKRARERLCYLLASCPRTEGELRGKLESGGYPREAIEAALCFGKEYHYIDDRAYVDAYVNSHKSRKSVKQMLYELRQKGIAPELLQWVESQNGDGERDQIVSLLRKKGYQGEESNQEQRRKLFAYLARRGFSFETINSVMSHWEQEESSL